MDQKRVGFVYVLANPAMPGLAKVGFTEWLPEDRAAKLRTTGVPVHFEVAFRALTSRPQEVEKLTHARLDKWRVLGDREFFRVPIADAIEAVRSALIDAGGIVAWSPSQPVNIRAYDRIVITLEAGQIFAHLVYPDILGPPTILDFWQAHSVGDLLEFMRFTLPNTWRHSATMTCSQHRTPSRSWIGPATSRTEL